MPNGDVTGEIGQLGLAEHLRHQTHASVYTEPRAVSGSYPSTLLSPMLK